MVEEKDTQEKNKEDTEIEIRFTDFLTVFKKSWFWMILVGVIVFVGGFTYSRFLKTDQYTAGFSMYLKPNVTESQNESLSFSIANALTKDSDSLFLSYDNVLKPVLEESGYQMTASDFKKCIQVKIPEEGSRVLYFSVTTADADMSIELAKKLEDRLENYWNSSDSIFGYPELVVRVDGVDENAARLVSNRTSNMMIALVAVLAAIVTYAIAFVVFLLDDRINNEEDLERHLNLNLLGSIPNRRESQRASRRGYYAYYSSRK